MPWTIIEHLFENDILSKLPKPDDVLPPIHRQEIIFVCSITKSGLDISSIKNLLIGLNKPYVYDIGRMEYDWSKSQWISKPEVSSDRGPAGIRVIFSHFVSNLLILLSNLQIHRQKITMNSETA